MPEKFPEIRRDTTRPACAQAARTAFAFGGSSRARAMTLVEVCMALGIFTFCIMALLGLLPTGMNLLRDTRSENIATNILTDIVSDIRVLPETQSVTTRYAIPLQNGSSGEIAFDANGDQLPTAAASDAVYLARWSVFERDPGTHTPARASVAVVWPARAAKPSGIVEMLVLFNKTAN